MPIKKLIPSDYTLSSTNTNYISITNPQNMYHDTSWTEDFATIKGRNSNTAYYCFIHGFDFSDIPSNATINSFTIKIKAYETQNSTSSTYRIRLSSATNSSSAISGTTVSTSLSTTVQTLTIPTGSLTWQQIVGYGSNFSIEVPIRRSSSSTPYIYVYGAEIEVDYSVPTNVYFFNYCNNISFSDIQINNTSVSDLSSVTITYYSGSTVTITIRTTAPLSSWSLGVLGTVNNARIENEVVLSEDPINASTYYYTVNDLSNDLYFVLFEPSYLTTIDLNTGVTFEVGWAGFHGWYTDTPGKYAFISGYGYPVKLFNIYNYSESIFLVDNDVRTTYSALTTPDSIIMDEDHTIIAFYPVTVTMQNNIQSMPDPAVHTHATDSPYHYCEETSSGSNVWRFIPGSDVVVEWRGDITDYSLEDNGVSVKYSPNCDFDSTQGTYYIRNIQINHTVEFGSSVQLTFISLKKGIKFMDPNNLQFDYYYVTVPLNSTYTVRIKKSNQFDLESDYYITSRVTSTEAFHHYTTSEISSDSSKYYFDITATADITFYAAPKYLITCRYSPEVTINPNKGSLYAGENFVTTITSTGTLSELLADTSFSATDNGEDIKSSIVMSSRTSGIYTIKNIISNHLIELKRLNVQKPFYVKINGEWISAVKVYTKINGTWTPSEDLSLYKKQNGSWTRTYETTDIFNQDSLYSYGGNTQSLIGSGSGSSLESGSGSESGSGGGDLPSDYQEQIEYIGGDDIILAIPKYYPNAVKIGNKWYHAVVIGDQVWLTSNLAYSDNSLTSHYFFNRPSLTMPGICYYDHESIEYIDNLLQQQDLHVSSRLDYALLYYYIRNNNLYVKDIASTSYWQQSSIPNSPGYNQSENNSLGLNLMPYNFIRKYTDGPFFVGADQNSSFWLSNSNEIISISYNSISPEDWEPNIINIGTYYIPIRLVSDKSPVEFSNWYYRTYGTYNHQV